MYIMFRNIIQLNLELSFAECERNLTHHTVSSTFSRYINKTHTMEVRYPQKPPNLFRGIEIYSLNIYPGYFCTESMNYKNLQLKTPKILHTMQ